MPAAPGGTTDIAARDIAEPLGKALGQPVVVVNRPGANGAIGAQALLSANPDGYTLFMATSGYQVITPHLVQQSFDAMKDMQPICMVYSAPQILVIRSSLEQVRTAQDFIRYARANPGKLNYATAGNGSVQHVTAILFESLTSTSMTHVPYKGTGPMLADLLASQVDLTFTTAPPLMGHLSGGRIRLLFVTAPERMPTLPDIPTAAEIGLNSFDVGSWVALYTSARVPEAVVERIAAAAKEIMATPRFRERAAAQGAVAQYLGPKELREFAAADYKRWGEVVRNARIKAD
ncbi:MAG: Bug family tripartite tricarboxylate transporter substrate binding protein [Burkholderiaceae bacterium]